MDLIRTRSLIRARLFDRLGLGRARVRADFKNTADDVAARLATTLPELETAFLAIGKSLDPLANGSHRLVDQCGMLLHLASGRENGRDVLRETLAILESPLACIDQCLGRSARLLDLLASCEHQTRELLKTRETMHDILAPLSYLTVLFRIESSRLSPDRRDTFTTVTTEVERMRRVVDETFAENARLLVSAQATLATVRTRLEADFRRHADEMTSKRAQIDDAIRNLDAQLSHNDERDLRMHNQSRAISAEVSRMVEGLQFQDIIQQKCTHIGNAIADPAFLANPVSARLQACHLDSVCSDLAKGHENITAALANIGRETERFDEICLKLEGLECMVAASDGMVQHLLEVLGAVDAILQVLTELADQANRTLGPMRDLTSTFTSAVVELAVNMRLIALNAQVRSVHCGDGTGLEVLATRTAEISRQTTDVTTANFAKLQGLKDSVAEMLESFGAFHAKGRDELGRYAGVRSDVETRLHSMRDRTLEAFTSISATLEEVRASTRDVDAALQAVPALRDRLSATAASLHDLHARHGTLVDSSPALSTSDYTMVSEHAIHASVVGAIPKSPAPAPDSFAKPPEPAPASPVPTTQAEAAPLGANVELF